MDNVKVMENTRLRMAVNTKVPGKMVDTMVLVRVRGKMVVNTKENGETVWPMDKVQRHTRMARFDTKVNGTMTSRFGFRGG